MTGTAFAAFGTALHARGETVYWCWRGVAHEAINDRYEEVPGPVSSVTCVLQEERITMTQATARGKVHGKTVGATTCAQPAIGQEQVIAYIAGDLTEDANREFVAHLTECESCLKEVVLWRRAQVLAEEASEVEPGSA